MLGIVAAFAVSNPHLSQQFENRCMVFLLSDYQEILTLPSWIDATELTGGNTEEDVIRRGFRFPPPEKGAVFTAGHIKDSNDCKSRVDHATTRKVLLCKIGVGRAFAVDSKDSLPDKLPLGYDSVYLHTEDEKAGSSKYRHDYYITNTAQILPQYLIHYDYDKNKESKSREVISEGLINRQASVITAN